MDIDRANIFPEHLIRKILSHLTVKDLVRTSILSREWRYRWATVPVLVFVPEYCPHTSNVTSLSRSEFISSIDQVLLLHTGPIDVLYLAGLRAGPDIDRWILHASRKSVKRLLLDVCDGPGQIYKLPSSLYTCSSLTQLSLRQCILRPPPSFNGFNSLRWLTLTQTTLAPHAFERLVSSCPLLVKLEVINCGELRSIKIDAPELTSICIGGRFDAITFGSVHMKLSEVYIELKGVITSKVDADTESYMTKFFTCLPGIKRLEVKSRFIEYLCVGLIPERLSTPFLDLYHLSICFNVNDMDESLAALCLFRSSPNLRELEIQVSAKEEVVGKEESSIWANENKCNCSFDQLRSVKIHGVSDARVDLEFIQFLVVNSSLLEEMTVGLYPAYLSRYVLEELLRYRRASTRVIINILD